MVDPSAFAGGVLDKQRGGWYVISSSRVERLMEDGRAVTYVGNLNGGGQP